WRDRQDRRAGGGAGAPFGARIRADRQHARGIRRPDPMGNRQVGEGHSRGQHQGAMTVRESDDFSACLGAGQRPSGGTEDTVIIQSTSPGHWEYRIDEWFGFSWRMWVRARRGAYSWNFPDWRRRRIARRSVEDDQLP